MIDLLVFPMWPKSTIQHIESGAVHGSQVLQITTVDEVLELFCSVETPWRSGDGAKIRPSMPFMAFSSPLFSLLSLRACSDPFVHLPTQIHLRVPSFYAASPFGPSYSLLLGGGLARR